MEITCCLLAIVTWKMVIRGNTYKSVREQSERSTNWLSKTGSELGNGGVTWTCQLVPTSLLSRCPVPSPASPGAGVGAPAAGSCTVSGPWGPCCSVEWRRNRAPPPGQNAWHLEIFIGKSVLCLTRNSSFALNGWHCRKRERESKQILKNNLKCIKWYLLYLQSLIIFIYFSCCARIPRLIGWGKECSKRYFWAFAKKFCFCFIILEIRSKHMILFLSICGNIS